MFNVLEKIISSHLVVEADWDYHFLSRFGHHDLSKKSSLCKKDEYRLKDDEDDVDFAWKLTSFLVLMADAFWIQSERCFIDWAWSDPSWHRLEKRIRGTELPTVIVSIALENGFLFCFL